MSFELRSPRLKLAALTIRSTGLNQILCINISLCCQGRLQNAFLASPVKETLLTLLLDGNRCSATD
jgi:hypothetical protein